ncbi:MAG: hypothetical protein MZV63_41615 [Marinilabiliales bacterium]|nr:hypothetical protein [Marinilabiliales bacterium]
MEKMNEKSIVTIILKEHKKGTSIDLIHSNIPDSDFTNITKGWNEYYFGSLIDFFSDEDE